MAQSCAVGRALRRRRDVPGAAGCPDPACACLLQIGQILLNPDSIQRGWTVGSERQAQGVSAMHCQTDITGDGVPDIVVGRSNGDLEVWTMDAAREPQKVCCSPPVPGEIALPAASASAHVLLSSSVGCSAPCVCLGSPHLAPVSCTAACVAREGGGLQLHAVLSASAGHPLAGHEQGPE